MYGALAHLYDNPARDLIAAATADAVSMAVSAAVGTGAMVLDLACGTGGVAKALAGAGHRVVAIDRSPAMLALARARVPSVRFIEGDIRKLAVDTAFDAVVIVGDVLNHLLEAPDVAATLCSARRALRPGGVLVMDTSTRALFESALWNSAAVTVEAPEGPVTMSAHFDAATGKGRIDGRQGPRADVVEERYWPATTVRRWLSDAGFRTIAHCAFNPIDLSATHPEVDVAKRLWTCLAP